MKIVIFALFCALILPACANAAGPIVPCIQIPGTPYTSCQPVTITHPLPVLIIGG